MCGSGQAVLRAVVSAALAGRLGDEVSFVHWHHHGVGNPGKGK